VQPKSIAPAQQEAELQALVQKFRHAIAELQERYDLLLEQSSIHAVHIPRDATPEQILRISMVNAEMSARREAERAGIENALAVMRSVLLEKEGELERIQQNFSAEARVTIGLEQMQQSAKRINHFATQLESELINLQAIAQRITPDCQTLYGKPPLTLNSSDMVKAIPYVVSMDQTFLIVRIHDAR